MPRPWDRKSPNGDIQPIPLETQTASRRMNAGGDGEIMKKSVMAGWVLVAITTIAAAALLWMLIGGIPSRPATAFSGAKLNLDGELYPRWISCKRLSSGDVRQLSMKFGLTVFVAVPGGDCSSILTIPATAPYPATWAIKDGSLNTYGILVHVNECPPSPQPPERESRSCNRGCPETVAPAEVQPAISLMEDLIAAPGVAPKAVAEASIAILQLQRLPSLQLHGVEYPWIFLRTGRWFESASQRPGHSLCTSSTTVAATKRVRPISLGAND